MLASCPARADAACRATVAAQRRALRAPRRREDRQLRVGDLVRARRRDGPDPRRVDRRSAAGPAGRPVRHASAARVGARRTRRYPAADQRPDRQRVSWSCSPGSDSPPAASSQRPSCRPAACSSARRPRGRCRAARAQPPTRADRRGRALPDGPNGRYLMGGQWLSGSTARQGLSQALAAPDLDRRLDAHHRPERVERHRHTEASMRGGVGWYRKDFKLPSSASALAWVIRFESVNYRSRVWLNGKPLGPNTGAYLPFEFVVPSEALNRGGDEPPRRPRRLRRTPKDFPPAGLTTSPAARSAAGGTTAASCARSTCAASRARTSRRSRSARMLPCATCAATMRFTALVRNAGRRPRADPRDRHASADPPSTSARRTVRAGARRRVHRLPARRRIRKLWSPDSPTLYPVDADRGGRRSQYSLKTGIRSIKVVNGRLLPQRPAAELPRRRPARGLQAVRASRSTTRSATSSSPGRKELGATLIRSHYPLHPYLEEQADRLGIMLWSEIPVYQVQTEYLKYRSVQQLAANDAARQHPDQRRPPVDHRLVDRERAQLARRARRSRR